MDIYNLLVKLCQYINIIPLFNLIVFIREGLKTFQHWNITVSNNSAYILPKGPWYQVHLPQIHMSEKVVPRVRLHYAK